jgi:MoxR-like ATPase
MTDLLASLERDVVGRRRELELTIAALSAHRHVVLEGPPGTGKSTLLRAVSHALGVGFEFVEGNAELTPARLIGSFDPARVLNEGYVPDAFMDGPLVTAMREGSLLYVEEINRIPEETLNVLITVMSEGDLSVPRLGRIAAAEGFRLVAAMNPFDAVGTARISGAVYDRVCRVSVGYQSHAEEVAIVMRNAPDADAQWVDKVVQVVRLTRDHPDLRTGSSVRGAIDAALVARSLGRLRGISPTNVAVARDAGLTALSGRVRVREGVARTAEEIILEIWASVFRAVEDDPNQNGDTGKAIAPTGATNFR